MTPPRDGGVTVAACAANGIMKNRPQRNEFGHPDPDPPPSKRGPIGPQGAREERRGGDQQDGYVE